MNYFSTKIKLGAATLNQTPFDWANNLSNIKNTIAIAKEQQVDLLLLPELCICGYGCEDLFLAEWFVEKCLQKLLSILPHTLDITVSVGLPMAWKGKIYNCACLIQNGEILGFTAKQNLANDGVHYEHRWFKAWQSGITESVSVEGKNYPFGDVTYNILGIKVGYEICEDMWHSENRPAKSHSQNGVQLILNPSASPFTFGKTKRREKIILDSTLSYNCTYLYANLLGNESGRIVFDGEIFMASNGKVDAQNKRFSFLPYNLLTQEYLVENQRLIPVSDSFVPASESKELEFCKAASLGLFDYLRKSKSKCYVLSLSGGADSSACAVLVRKMIDFALEEMNVNNFLYRIGVSIQNNENESSEIEYITSQLLHCAYQATENSSKDTFLSARELAKEIGATFYNWHIDDALKVYTKKMEEATNSSLSWENDDLVLQNIQARARAPFIWLLANMKNGLLLTTSNRSEGDVGYCTMDGDTAGGLAPIAGVDKTFIQHWLRWAEKKFRLQSLQYVNNLTPTAELRPLEKNQTDESDLMPYPLLLQIEILAIQERLSPKQVFETLKNRKEYAQDLLKTSIQKFYRLWQRNQWKRERLAPSFHLDNFNVDPKTWCRFPILGSGFEEELNDL